MIGKRYENEQERRRENRPMVSVILDEFAPFAYFELCPDPADGARNQYRVPVRPAGAAAASDGGPWLQR